MLELLGYAPVIASLVLGLIYLGMGEGSPALKAGGVVVFLVAAYLQFFSSHAIAGVLIQCVLAFTLEMWRRLST